MSKVLIPPPVLLSVRELSVSFGGVKAVSNVSFDVRKGEIFTLIGPNGAGKTTLFNLISRIYQPTSGEVRFADTLLTSVPAHQVAGHGIARTFQNIELFEQATVLQNLLIGGHTHYGAGFLSQILFTKKAMQAEVAARYKAEEVIHLLGIHRYRHSLVEGLPYGIRKIVELARALCSSPKLLLLDEPSSGLNSGETSVMASWILEIRENFDVTVLMVEHDMGLVSRVSDRVLALSQGEMLAQGTVAEVKCDPRVVEAYLGTGDIHAEPRAA